MFRSFAFLAVAITIVLAGLAYAQQPAPADRSKSGSQAEFKRIDTADEAQLRAELRNVPIVDLTQASHVREESEKESTSLEFFQRSPGVSPDQKKQMPRLEDLPKYHKLVFEELGLPGRIASDCQLGADEAQSLVTWSTQLRQNKLVTNPSGSGEWESPRSTHMTGVETVIQRQNLVLGAGIPALVQMFQCEGADNRKVLVDLLKQVESPKAALALARLSVYDPSPSIREAAVRALSGQSAEQYRPVLLAALRYPWPLAADHAAEAIVALNDKEAVPALQKMLDEPDPATPIVQPGTGKPPQVPAMVRINHLRNCRLCHPTSTKSTDVLRGPVPTPGLPLAVAYYSQRPAPTTIFVRADVTYLRQDFSVMVPVDNKDKWPSTQRFDFVIGRRDATPDELARLAENRPRTSYPQREAVQWALAELSR